MPKNYVIPNIIKKLNPKIKAREYQILQSDPGFQDKVAFVCENCFLQIASSANQYENLSNMKQKFQIQNKQFFGIGKLMPDKTSRRFNLSYWNYQNQKQQQQQKLQFVPSQRNSQLTETLYSRKQYVNQESNDNSRLKKQEQNDECLNEQLSQRKYQLKEISDLKQTDFSTQDEDYIQQRNLNSRNFKKLLSNAQQSNKKPKSPISAFLQEHPKKNFFSSLFRNKQKNSQLPYLNESEISLFDMKISEQRTKSQQEQKRIKLKKLEVYSQNNFLFK